MVNQTLKEAVLGNPNMALNYIFEAASIDEMNSYVEKFKQFQSMKRKLASSKLFVGQKVWFYDKNQNRIDGTILKINRKTVRVKAGTVTWRVTSTLLHEV